jgi:hypothetical protein
MEDVYSLCNVIEYFCRKKLTKPDGNRQGKSLAIKCKALKWVNENNAPPKGAL